MRYLKLLLLLSLSAYSFGGDRRLYIGKDSDEATLTFDHWVQISPTIQENRPAIKAVIESQLKYLVGTTGIETDFNKVKAVPHGQHKIRFKKVEHIGEIYIARYSYKGRFVIQNTHTDIYPITLPINPELIYASAIEQSTSDPTKLKIRCVDPHYPEEEDFWYFWNPFMKKCPMREGADYLTTMATVIQEDETEDEIVFPEYDRLADENNVIKISLLMGMDNSEKSHNPNISGDYNAINFRDIKSKLLKRGYQNSKLSIGEMGQVWRQRGFSPIPWIENFTRTFEAADGREIELQVQMFFGLTDITEDSEPFHFFLQDALENSSVVMYDGHSGLGTNLNLRKVERASRIRLKPNRNRYQIYFFNSCSSYAAYNDIFFARKKTDADPNGTQNLDILTNGLMTMFNTMPNSNFEVIKAVETWVKKGEWTSYQTLAKRIDSDNLFGINGAEDNPNEKEIRKR